MRAKAPLRRRELTGLLLGKECSKQRHQGPGYGVFRASGRGRASSVALSALVRTSAFALNVCRAIGCFEPLTCFDTVTMAAMLGTNSSRARVGDKLPGRRLSQ